jgi:hypothetical protein
MVEVVVGKADCGSMQGPAAAGGTVCLAGAGIAVPEPRVCSALRLVGEA